MLVDIELTRHWLGEIDVNEGAKATATQMVEQATRKNRRREDRPTASPNIRENFKMAMISLKYLDLKSSRHHDITSLNLGDADSRECRIGIGTGSAPATRKPRHTPAIAPTTARDRASPLTKVDHAARPTRTMR